MNKIAITGHTSGIGKACFELFQSMGWEVTGYSISTGHDIGLRLVQDEIIKEIEQNNIDTFINNAYDVNSYGQVDLLLKWSRKFNDDRTKTIVNVGSISTNTNVINDSMLHYVTKKAALHHLCRELQSKVHFCRYMLIKPGFVDTPLVSDLLNKQKHAWLDPFQVAIHINTSIGSPTTYVRELTVTGRLYGT